mgnify:CR=1 FL=1
MSCFLSVITEYSLDISINTSSFQSEVTINDNVNKFPIIVPGIDNVQSKQLTITIVYEGVIEVSNFVMKACVPKQGQGTSN